MSVPRFDPGPHQMTPSSEGAYVRYEDYAKLEKALEQAVRFLPEYGWVGTPSEPGKEFLAFGPKFAYDAPHLAAYLREREDKR